MQREKSTMFARPGNTNKKMAVSVKTKPQAVPKTKTVASKSGVKSQQHKKSKPGEKAGRQKPAPRVEAGYSLYSTESEDQVSETFRDMQMCEKILTHLKHKQKSKQMSKSPKKGESPAKPKALNDITSSPTRTLSPAYGFPYGAAAYLQQYPPQDISQTTNPVFNFRLASSTPDPDKHLSNQDAGTKFSSNNDPDAQEIPERDSSSVSSVPPSLSHLKNMADMVDIYKQLEINKKEQLQKETAIMQSEKAIDREGNLIDFDQLRKTIDQQRKQQDNQNVEDENVSQGSQPVSSCFVPSYPQAGFQPIQSSLNGSPVFPAFSQLQPVTQPHLPDSQSQYSLEELRRDSNITAFQPYLSRDSLGFQPPQSWIKETVSPQVMACSQQTHSVVEKGLPLSQQPLSEIHESGEPEELLSGRSEKSGIASDTSRGTDYVPLPKPGASAEVKVDANIIFQKENGLYQIHHKSRNDQPVSPSKVNLDRSGSLKSNVSADINPSKTVTDNQNQQTETVNEQSANIHETPERDVPQNMQRKQSDGSHTFTVDSQTSRSQNVSEVTTSTPRNQNNSGTGSSTNSSHGNIVFLPNPNDSNTQNVIGYIPGVPIVPSSNQPVNLPVAYSLHPAQVAQLATQTPSGSAGSQIISGNQGQPMMSQNVSGSSYHSAAYSQAVAAGDIGARKLRYLLKELRECTKVTKDVEVSRLVKELDSAVDAIPQLGVTFNLQTEIDLAIQPLRSENSQLRRKLRLLNQHLKEKEIAESQEPKDVNFELLHLQTSNEVLQKTVREEKESKARLAAEVQFLMDQIHKMKVERSKMITEISEKETEQLKVRQESLLETQKLRHDVDLMKKDQESTVNKLEALEKENHILQITLQQRDVEIGRQQDVLETMKESIGELLHELDQSRSGDKTWDQNQSYGLHKLMKIVEEESCVLADDRQSQTQRKVLRTPERRKLPFTSSEASDITPRLTRAALAFHNRRDVSPPRRQGPASESEINTLIEMENNFAKSSPIREAGSNPKHRRTSSSSPVHVKNGRPDSYRHQRTSSTPVDKTKDRKIQNENKEDLSRFRYDRYRKESHQAQQRRAQSPQGRPPLRHLNNDGERSNVGPTEVSVEQSRYSVTDYFNKYHPSQQMGSLEPRSRPPYGKNLDSKEMYESEQFTGQIDKQFRTNDIDDRTLRSDGVRSRNIKQLTLFKGTNYDTTISAIHDDDNVSSVSMNTISTANTTDDRKFRNGIATLDANIARLQKALQKTKSMLS